MHKKLRFLFFILLACSLSVPSFAQRGKSELAIGYGRYSLYQFVNLPPYNTSSGTISLAYRYYVSPSVTIGLGYGYERISNWASFSTFSPEVSFKYLDTKNSYRRVRLYGSVAYGLTVLNDLHTGKGQADESGAKLWGFQATPIGIRMGRQFAWFFEVGMGYKGLVHGGVCARFPKRWHRNEEETNN